MIWKELSLALLVAFFCFAFETIETKFILIPKKTSQAAMDFKMRIWQAILGAPSNGSKVTHNE
jgi:hypothetical protein